MMQGKKPETIFLADYQEPAYRIEEVELRIGLEEELTTVRSLLRVRAAERTEPGVPFVLNGQDLELISLVLEGELLSAPDFSLDEDFLTIFKVPEYFSLAIETRIKPHENTKLEGLYYSGGIFSTQCEAEGFRRITFYQDRSDVLALFTTTIEADREKYPVLLANGNLVKTGKVGEKRHFATWHDPFPKPSYLFAMVAGDLVWVEDNFTTSSGREVLLQIYVEAHNRQKCGHAMHSLKKSMAWDEAEYGLEYDLDRYMILAVDAFNMGAMENKGLNIFNSKYVLADPETATDDDFQNIEAVIAHEYFHNWTGNRVTCRDWFQVSLKEGLTVFRDQEFTADQVSKPVKRIADVRLLRDHQFPEDAGPMAHPVRPTSYIEINNFYTVTVYEKGAELIRMLHTLLGQDLFRAGVRKYLSEHDGTAATTDDFVAAMEKVSGRDLTRFRRWYSQAGTPELVVETEYEPEKKEFQLIIRQSCPATPGQEHKKPFHIPVAMGLLDGNGQDIPLLLVGEKDTEIATSRILELYEKETKFRFIEVPEKPVLSLLRNFSAPVILRDEADVGDLQIQYLHDSDPFNRWEAGQKLALLQLERLIEAHQKKEPMVADLSFLSLFEQVLGQAADSDYFYGAQLITLPSEKYVSEAMDVVDVDAVHQARKFLRHALAVKQRVDFEQLYKMLQKEKSSRYDPVLAGKRCLKNLCLDFLMVIEDDEVVSLCLEQYKKAVNMTDSMGALRPLVHSSRPEKIAVLDDFFEKWQNEPLVMDKWFALQATAPLPATINTVKRLLNHAAFSIKNPNRVRSLIGSFAALNPVCFHAVDGQGYNFLAEQILTLDAINPQVAARLTGNFTRWRRFDSRRQELMRTQLERLAVRKGLSRDVYEVVSKSLL